MASGLDRRVKEGSAAIWPAGSGKRVVRESGRPGAGEAWMLGAAGGPRRAGNRVGARGRLSVLCSLFSDPDASLGLATTRSPTPFGAVPWARCGFTAEFGMGSGGARTP